MPGVVRWPTSVRYMESASGAKAFVIDGIYEPKTDVWTSGHDANWVMRRLKIFAETDSLAINEGSHEAWFFTEKTPEEFLGSFDKIATFSGCIPQLEELIARDWIGEKFDAGAYVKIGQYEIVSSGGLLYAPSECDSSELRLVFLGPKYVPFRTNSTQVVLVSGDLGGTVQVDTRQGEDVPYSIVSAYSTSRTPDFASVRLVGGGRGVAKLNETREHCKGHMEHALRIYNAAGSYIWLAEEGLHGAWGLWARDLNADGVDELLVIAEDHGNRRLIVYGTDAASNGN